MFRKTSILKQNEWSRYSRLAKHKMQFHRTKCNFTAPRITSHHITCNSRHPAQSIIAMATFVVFDVNPMDEVYIDLYRQAIEIKQLRLKCNPDLQLCRCHVMLDTDGTSVIACAFYHVTTCVFIEVVAVKTLKQRHGQALMKQIISLYPTLTIHLIALNSVIKFYLTLEFYLMQCDITRCAVECLLLFKKASHMVRDPFKKLTRSMRVEEYGNSDVLDPNTDICEDCDSDNDSDIVS